MKNETTQVAMRYVMVDGVTRIILYAILYILFKYSCTLKISRIGVVGIPTNIMQVRNILMIVYDDETKRAATSGDSYIKTVIVDCHQPSFINNNNYYSVSACL